MTTETKGSHEMNAADAVIMITNDEFPTVDALNAFTAEEYRKTVLSAKDKKVAEIEAAIAIANTPTPAQTPPTVAPTVLSQDSWRYHETEEPRIFKAGEAVPEGWHSGQSTLKRLWARDANGAFSRIDK